MKNLPLEQYPSGTLGALERYTGTNRIPIGRSRGDGCACDIVAEVSGGGGVAGQTDGDKLAALFVAAPQLLAACEFSRGMVGDMPETPLEVFAMEEKSLALRNYLVALRGLILTGSNCARAAIAKATGN